MSLSVAAHNCGKNHKVHEMQNANAARRSRKCEKKNARDVYPAQNARCIGKLRRVIFCLVTSIFFRLLLSYFR